MVEDIETARLADSENDPLIMKKCPSSGPISAPFNLKDFEKPLKAYEQLVVKNGGIIESLESTLRSLCYILPGRFTDAEFVSEMLFATLNLVRYYNDCLLGKMERSMSLHQRNWLAYLNFLKSRHPLMKSLLTALNIIQLLQIPAEMVVAKLAASKQALFAVLLETAKMILKFGLWQGSGWRPVPSKLSVSLDRSCLHEDNNEGLLESDPVKKLESKMDALELSLRDNERGVENFLKGHKSANLSPREALQPTTNIISWTRELAHLTRPTVYAFTLWMLASKSSQSRIKTWSPLVLSFALDLYSKWPELGLSNDQRSTLEAEERSRRLLDFLYYPLRGPLMENITDPLIESIESRFQGSRLAQPLIDTINIYRKLCKNVYFYTSAS